MKIAHSAPCNVNIAGKPFEKGLNSYFCVGSKITAKCVPAFDDVFRKYSSVSRENAFTAP